MKFWTKAIVDTNVQEQLLVEASSVSELQEQLERLLKIVIAELSVTDFQTQVVEKLEGGEDIITVNVRSQPQPPRGAAVAALDVDLDGTVAAMASSELLLSPGGDGGSHRTSLRRGDDDTDKMSLNSSVNRIGSSRRPSFRIDTSPAKALFSEAPPVERICLTRDEIELLLHPRFGDKYVADIKSCFARIKEPTTYSIFQISDVTLDGTGASQPVIVLDCIYHFEKRSLDTVSNAPCVTSEVIAWSKKMLVSSRSYPTVAFVEAKQGDVRSALSAAENVISPVPVTPSTDGAAVSNALGRFSALVSGLEDTSPAAEEALDATAVPTTPVHARSSEKAPSRRNSCPKETEPTPQHPLHQQQEPKRKQEPRQQEAQAEQPGREKQPHRQQRVAARRHTALSLTPNTRLVQVRTNDSIKHLSFGEADPSSNSVLIYGCRHSNVGAKSARPSDYAGCSFSINLDSGTIEDDRDITFKGLLIYSAPIFWNGAYCTLGRSMPGDRAAQAAFTDTRTQQMVQRFVKLQGSGVHSLFDPPQFVNLPFPMWSLNEGYDPLLLRPQLLVVDGAVHAVYMVRTSVVETVPATREVSPQHTTPSTAPTPAPRSRRHSSLSQNAAAATAVAAPLDDATRLVEGQDSSPSIPNGSGAAAGSAHSSISFHSLDSGNEAGTDGAGAAGPAAPREPSPVVQTVYKYGIAHAVCRDATLSEWTVLNSHAPIVSRRQRQCPPFLVQRHEDARRVGAMRIVVVYPPEQPSSVSRFEFHCFEKDGTDSPDQEWSCQLYSCDIPSDNAKMQTNLRGVSFAKSEESVTGMLATQTSYTKFLFLSVPLVPL